MASGDDTAIYTRRTLHASDLVRIGEVIARPRSDAAGSLNESDAHVVVMPLRGLFRTHFSARDAVLGTANDAVLLPQSQPHRFSFPGCIGDHCLVMRWSPEALDRELQSLAAFAPRVALGAALLVDRSLLWRQVRTGSVDPIAADELAVKVLAAILDAAKRDSHGFDPAPGRTSMRQRKAVDRAQQALIADPFRRWSLTDLASAASVSPYHLARLFRRLVGMSVFEFVLRIRITHALSLVLDSDADLATVAVDSGFAHHSHLTARFRQILGCTPRELRRRAGA
ncbi:MAG: helix-turn-helix transcriptional regulator [Steroidobacteraceae bacterium]